jgi:hypothetical protein
METERRAARSWITEGIAIAGITAIAYFWTLFYELGFSSYFSIPYEFISLSPAGVLVTAGRFLLIPIALFLFVMFLVATHPYTTYLGGLIEGFQRRRPRNSMIVTLCALVAISSLIWWASLPVKLVWLRYMMQAIAGLLLVAFFVLPLVRQKGLEGTYWDKLIAEYTPRPRINPESRAPSPSPAPGLEAFTDVILIIIALIAIVYGNGVFRLGGRADAQMKEEFQIVPQSSDVPELIVLRVYGDYLLTAPFNRSTKEVEKKLFILKVSEMGKTPLIMEKVGPLQVKP